MTLLLITFSQVSIITKLIFEAFNSAQQKVIYFKSLLGIGVEIII